MNYTLVTHVKVWQGISLILTRQINYPSLQKHQDQMMGVNPYRQYYSRLCQINKMIEPLMNHVYSIGINLLKERLNKDYEKCLMKSFLVILWSWIQIRFYHEKYKNINYYK